MQGVPGAEEDGDGARGETNGSEERGEGYNGRVELGVAQGADGEQGLVLAPLLPLLRVLALLSGFSLSSSLPPPSLALLIRPSDGNSIGECLEKMIEGSFDQGPKGRRR